MTRHLFLTGEKQVGKSTVLRRLLAGREAGIGGFLTVRVLIPGGGSVHMLRAGREEVCSAENRLFVKHGGVITMEPDGFDRLGCAILRESRRCGLLVMDELGMAETDALLFRRAVLDCLDGDIPVCGVLQQGESDFLEAVKAHPGVRVVTVTAENRAQLPRQLRRQGW